MKKRSVCVVFAVCAPGMKVRDRAAAQGRATAMAVRGNEGVVQQDQREGGREACREKGWGREDRQGRQDRSGSAILRHRPPHTGGSVAGNCQILMP